MVDLAEPVEDDGPWAGHDATGLAGLIEFLFSRVNKRLGKRIYLGAAALITDDVEKFH